MRSIADRNLVYRVRLLTATAASLLVVTVVFRLPYAPTRVTRPILQSAPDGIGIIDNRHAVAGALAIRADSRPDVIPSAGTKPAPSMPVAAADTVVQDETLRFETFKLPVLEFAELMPEVRGGLRAYYIHIEYPEQARMRGLEGLLTLTFTVNTDGSTSDIQVTRALHPLLDSAAVRALRNTAFIPGQHGGTARRVRMRLPVRFQLVDPPVDSTAVS